MGNEMSKATARRMTDWRYANRWFVGHGLDIGCGYDVLKSSTFHKITAVTGYDSVLGSGDAQYLSEVADGTYDFVVSAHCLEHMHNPAESLENWLRVVKPGGFLIVTVPEYELYEHKHWPSKFNGDHKTSWTMKGEFKEIRPDHVVYLPLWLISLNVASLYSFDIEMMQVLTEHFNFSFGDLVDQTGGPAECAIEFVLRKN